LNAGRSEQRGTPREVFDRPANRFVAEFVGFENILRLPDGREGAVRAEDVELSGLAKAGDTSDRSIRLEDGCARFGGVVDLATRQGRRTLLLVRVGETEVRALIPEEAAPARGTWVDLRVPERSLVVL
jgi:ABC-type Fe3+/spermidine/putrescine transport system ATPase subunit